MYFFLGPTSNYVNRLNTKKNGFISDSDRKSQEVDETRGVRTGMSWDYLRKIN